MKRLMSFGVVAAVAFAGMLGAACGADSGAQSGELGERETGRLRLPLVTADHATFRLRDAAFVIRNAAGTVVASLDSESDPDATELTADLNPGPYVITLAADWSLESLSDDGTATPVNAALVTPNPTSIELRNARVAEIIYTFTTAAGEITFGAGGLSIGVDVVQPESLTSCRLVNSYYDSNCPSGQTCLLANDSGRSFCASPGTLPVGAPCDDQQCVAGAQCLSQTDGAAPVCTLFCNPMQVTFGCNCVSLGFDEQVGICAPPPAGACDLLSQSGCAEGDACQYPGGNFGTCGEPGTRQRGESCVGEICAAGLDCIGDDPVSGSEGRCVAFCDLDHPSCEPLPDSYYSYCSSAGTGNVGRCTDYF